jgi:hypothetical protein
VVGHPVPSSPNAVPGWKRHQKPSVITTADALSFPFTIKELVKAAVASAVKALVQHAVG